MWLSMGTAVAGELVNLLRNEWTVGTAVGGCILCMGIWEMAVLVLQYRKLYNPILKRCD